MPRRGSPGASRRAAVALWTALAILTLLGARTSHAQSKSITLDYLTLEPSRLPGTTKLRAYVSAMSIEGEQLAIDPGNLKLEVSGSALRAPRGIGLFGLSDAELSVVIVIEATLEYSQIFPMLQEVIAEELLGKLPDRARVAVVGYGETVQSGRLANLRTARTRLAALTADAAPSDPALLESVEHALSLFRRMKTDPPGRPMRKVIVLLSDGRDREGDRDRVTAVGQRAARDGARVLSLAYSPTNTRRPLLNLGELSKQSRGTFRWLRTGERQSWQAQIRRVREQIEQQLVLTYFLDADDTERVAGKRATVRLALGNSELVSNDAKVPMPSCAQSPCEAGQWCQAGTCVTPRKGGARGLAGWITLLIGIAATVLVGLGGVGYVMARRQAKAGPAGTPPGSVPPGAVPPGSLPPGPPGGALPPPAGAATGNAPPGSQPPGQWAGSLVPSTVPTGVPSLYVVSGPRAGQRIPLFHGFSIGKAPGSSLVIDDGYASSHHAQIGIDGRGFCTIYDQGSTNGTFVNGVRITEMPLEHGAALRIGATELRFLAE